MLMDGAWHHPAYSAIGKKRTFSLLGGSPEQGVGWIERNSVKFEIKVALLAVGS
jgi:hypothetical protein